MYAQKRSIVQGKKGLQRPLARPLITTDIIDGKAASF